jgi:thiamine-monophosphate kinase
MQVGINAAMDISDGLSTDLLRMMEASRTSACVEAARIPVHNDVPEQWPSDQRISAALSDGEDFELLLSVSGKRVDQLISDAIDNGFQLTQIGHVNTAGESTLLMPNGERVTLRSTGWQHSL